MKRALQGACEVEWQVELPGSLPWWRREPDRPLDPTPSAAWIDEQGVSTGLSRPRVAPAVFLETAALALGLDPVTLTAASSGHKLTRQRTLVSAVAIERWWLRPSELAPLFGRRNDVVSRWVRWGVDRRRVAEEFREAYEALDRHLSSKLPAEDPRA